MNQPAVPFGPLPVALLLLLVVRRATGVSLAIASEPGARLVREYRDGCSLRETHPLARLRFKGWTLQDEVDAANFLFVQPPSCA